MKRAEFLKSLCLIPFIGELNIKKEHKFEDYFKRGVSSEYYSPEYKTTKTCIRYDSICKRYKILNYEKYYQIFRFKSESFTTHYSYKTKEECFQDFLKCEKLI